MPAEIVALENEAIEHAVSGGFPVTLPRLLRNQQGKIETGINIRKNSSDRARLMEFIDGIVLDTLSDISINLRNNLGKTLAEFDVLMRDFDHPAAHRNHRWNLAEAGQHKPKLALIKESDQRDLLARAFDFWSVEARPNLSLLPHQFIHGDAHGENILVQGDRISGLVDFGDCCINPTICELGICLPYMMMGKEDPLQIAADIVAAYQEVRPLCVNERAVLLPLICGRLAVTICVAAQRRRIDPAHPGWFGSSAQAWDLLEYLLRNKSLWQGSGFETP